MKVFLFLCFSLLLFLLHAQTTLQGSFSPLQEKTNLVYRVQEGSVDVRCKLSLSSSGISAEPTGSYKGDGWNIVWKPKLFLGKTWFSNTLETKDFNLSYLYDDKQRKAFQISGNHGAFAYVLANWQASIPSVYAWQGKGGSVFCFWNAESSHAKLSLVCAWADGERFSLSHDISLAEGTLTFDWKFSGNTQQQARAVALAMKNQNLRIAWRAEIQAGSPPVFGGQKQAMERSVHSKISYTPGNFTLEGSLQSRVQTKMPGGQEERTSCQLAGTWKHYSINVVWDSIDGKALELEAEQGKLQISKDGITFSLLLKKGPLSLAIKRDTKENLSLTYSFRFTSGPDTESLLPR